MTTTTNGTLTPPSQPPAPGSPSLAKRKRSETGAIVSNGASVATPGKQLNGSTYSLQTVLEDILAVLKSYDTKPSILSHPITSSIARASSGEADSKRTKLTPPDSATSISNMVQEGAYNSLDALEKDVESATSEILASIGGSELSAVPVTLEETRLQTKVLAFRKILKNLISREEARQTHVHKKQQTDTKQDTKDSVETPDAPIKEEIKEEVSESRTVLTLYGSAQGPKQLFSSLQQPQNVSPTDPSAKTGTAIKVTLPLRESTLPNIITTTEVFPTPDNVDGKKKKVPTIGDVFRAPAHLPQISPPKVAKSTTTRGNTITFAPAETPKPSRKQSHSYAGQNLSTGFWLGYGGVDMPKDSTSPTAKQKSRQRALSTGEAQQPPSELIMAAVQQAREDALFRSAYSSFAPTRDDASAIVPEETKNKVWWQKVGEKRFNDMFPIDPELLDSETSPKADTNGAANEEEDFKDAVENFVPVEGEAEDEEKTDIEKGTDEMLKEMSELLETLASHQRIRNSSLTTNPRTPVVQNSSLASLAGSPSTPSSEEIDIYQMLKAQLTLMISQLPPYAVAKLNGDQLDELNISRTILFETREYHGIGEEDQLSRAAKAPTMPTATPATLYRSGSGSHSGAASAPFGRSTPSALPPSARPVQAAQSYYPQQQPAHRSPSVHYQRSSSAQGFPPTTPSYAANPRQSFPATQGFNQQTPRPNFNQATPGQFYQQQRSGQIPMNFPHGTPQAQMHNRYAPQQGTQNGYYQRPQNVAPMYNAAQTPQARTGSPLKTNPVVAPSAFGSRPSYGTPVSGGQLRSTYYGPSQYGTPQGQTTGTPTAFAGMPSNPQQMMMDRQQAQVAAQSQARLAAQNSFSARQGSGTPQPPPNGQFGGGQVNGTSMTT